ncbi:MAG: MarR family transcriptional regulator [Alphaproteobacteria bacterium]
MEVRAVLDLLRGAVVEGVRRDSPDLTARQLAVLLIVYVSEPPHTVRGLAAALNVSKPAITRAIDRLSELNLVRRRIDEADRRNVLIQRTVPGSVFVSEYTDLYLRAGLAGVGPTA